MKKFPSRAFLPMSLFTALTLVSNLVFSQSDNPLFRHLPPDAEKIYHVNLPVFLGKVDLNALAPFAQASKGDAGQVMALLQDPTLTGVSLKQDVFIAQHGNALTSKLIYTTILVHLADSGKFISLVEKGDTKFHRIHQKSKEPVAVSGNTGYAWSDKLAVITTIKSNDSSTKLMSAPVSYGTLAVEKSLASLKGYDNSPYLTNTFFKAGMSDDADFHFWAPQGSLLTGMFAMMKNKMPNPQQFIQAMNKIHNNSLLALRFDNGRILVTSKTPYSSDSAAAYLPAIGHMDPSILARIPGGPLLAFMSINFNFQAFGAYMQKFGATQKIDSILEKTGMKFNDIIGAFKGDFLIAVVSPEENGSTAGPKPNAVFVTSIGDKAAFDKLDGKLHLLDTTSGVLNKLKASYKLQNNLLVIGSQTQTAAFFASDKHRGTEIVTPVMERSPMNLVIDCKTVGTFLHGIMGNAPSDPKAMIALRVLDGLDKIIYSAGAMDANIVETSFEIRFNDQSTNSLKTIFSMIH